MKCVHALVFSFLLSKPLAAQSIISTLAGTDWIFPGDGRPALQAPLGRVLATAVDREGRVVFSDRDNNMVMRLDSDGVVRVIAGNGLATFSGEGEPATNASLWAPAGIAFDSRGNLYIADMFNHRVRRVSPDGVITTAAGTGECGFSGDNGPATNARLCVPYSLAVDAGGTLFINDRNNLRIRRVSPNGVITTIAGNGGSQVSLADNSNATAVALGDAESIALDSSNNLYIAEFGIGVVRRITAAGAISLFGRVDQPGGLAFDREGVLWATSLAVHRIGRIRNGAFEPSVGSGAGLQGGNSSAALFRSPSGIAFDTTGALVIADRENFRVRRAVLGGESSILAGNGQFQAYPDGIAGQNAFFNGPFGVAADTTGLLIADTANARVRRMISGQVSTIAGNGIRGLGGSGVPALQTSAIGPEHSVSDREGNAYFTDANGFDRAGHVIRRVARASGQITTFAGTGVVGLGGERIAATSAPLAYPAQLAFDSPGNMLIAEELGNRIRIIENGQIRTFAGSAGGERGIPAENAQATAVRLNGPRGVAIDRAGNVYISDTGNAAIRRVTSQGTISTVAGGGTRRLNPGQSAQAREVQLGQPVHIAVDDNGVVYFADRRQHLVYRLADGMLTPVAGTGRAGFAGDGALATQSLLNTPNGVAVDARGNVLIADTGNNRIRMIQPVAPTFTVSVTSKTFAAKSSSEPPVPQPVLVSGSLTGMRFTAAARSDRSWLSVNTSDGVMPTELELMVSPAGLAQGTYAGTVTLTSPGANPPTRTIDVQFAVAAPDSPRLSLEETRASFSLRAGDPPSERVVAVRNRGGGMLGFEAASATQDGAPWLNARAENSPIDPTGTGMIRITVDPAGLEPDTYSGAVTITSGKAIERVPVQLVLAERPRPRILATQPALRFVAVAGGGAPLPQTFGVINSGRETLSFRIEPEFLKGEGWLSIVNGAGSVRFDASAPPQVSVRVNPAGLPPDNYTALLRIVDPRGLATNAPQNVAVYLDVLPEGSKPGPDIAPAGVFFSGLPDSRPGSQSVAIANLGAEPLEFSSARTLPPGQDWLTVAPATGTIAAGDQSRLVIQPNFTGLAPGVYRSTVNLRFSDGTTRALNVVSLVSGADGNKTEREQNTCLLQPVIDKPSTQEVLGLINLSIRTPSSTCPGVFTSGSVKVLFSNGDRMVEMTHNGNNVWNGSWNPTNRNVTSVRLTFVIALLFGNRPARFDYDHTLTFRPVTVSPPPTPLRTAVVDSATYQEIPLVAPGSLVTIFGSDLAPGPAEASDLQNLPKNLGGTRVELAGKPLPLLYVSGNQINAVIPYGLFPNETHSLVVVRETTPSVPDDLDVARARPGIFIPDTSKPMQGSIIKASDRSVVTPSNPVARGEEVIVICAGLGDVDQVVEAGTPPPSAPPARVVSVPAVLVGGLAANVSLAILSTDGGGRYEVRTTIPSDAPTGDEVEVRIRTGGQTSPAVHLSIR